MTIKDLKFVAYGNGIIRVYVNLPRELGWAEFDMTGNLIKSCEETWCMHFPHELNEEIATVIRSLQPAPFTENVYLRFNEMPKDGKSTNWATGKKEKGLSVYPLTYDIINGCYKISGNVLQGAMIQYILQGANIYFVAGNEIGTGSDNEPLLSNVKILAKARYDIKKEGYVINEKA